MTIRAIHEPLPKLDAPNLDSPLDVGIKEAVDTLREYGVETYESCQGGPAHSYPEPTVCFHGQQEEGYRAFAAVRERNLPVYALKRVWSVEDGELVGPHWELIFRVGC